MLMTRNHPAIFSVAAALYITTGYAADAACDKSSALGVSRTITIDSSGGKLYGGLQYDSANLLRDREVVLTFDDGPLRRHTRKVLKALATHCTKATFFMVGRMAVADPAMVREVEAAGHTIAHHTWSHQNLKSRSARRAGGQIELGISAVAIAAKKPTSPFFRFPYLADPNSMIAYGKSRNLAIFSIDIDAYDYRTKSPGRVHSNIMSQLKSRGKGIMLFHDIQTSTANAMQRLLDTLKRDRYKIVHLVAKAPVTTLKDFDAQAQGLHDKRRMVATPKSVGGGDYENASKPQIVRRRPAKKAATTKVAARRSPTPQVNPFSNGQPAITQPKARPVKDWRRSIWGN